MYTNSNSSEKLLLVYRSYDAIVEFKFYLKLIEKYIFYFQRLFVLFKGTVWTQIRWANSFAFRYSITSSIGERKKNRGEGDKS